MAILGQTILDVRMSSQRKRYRWRIKDQRLFRSTEIRVSPRPKEISGIILAKLVLRK